MEKYFNKAETLKLWLCVGLCTFGCLMLIAGFFAPPIGTIHNSILIALGEILTFSGSLAGINYSYSTKMKEMELRFGSNEKQKIKDEN